MSRSKRLFYSVLAAVSIGLVGCSTVDVPTVKPVTEQQPQQQVAAEFTAVDSSNEVLVNNGEDLDNRITITDEPITFNGDSLSTQSVEATLGLKLVAHIKSPIVEGETVQATAVRVENGTLVASYNMKGPKFLGAVDIVDLNDNFTGRTAKYTTADVHSVAFRDNTIYTVQGFSDDALDYTARMQMLSLDAKEVKEVPIKGYVANSVLVDEKQVYVTSGSNGGLTVMSRDDLSNSKTYGMTGARWVDIDGNRLAVAMGSEVGENGALAIANLSNLDSMIEFGVKGMNLPEAKSTVDLYKDYAFVAAGPTGVQVHSLKTGNAIGSVKPDITHAASQRFVANAASVDQIGNKEYLFLANGEGVYAAEFAVEGENFKHQMLGKLNFEAAESINHVLVTGKYLILAAGLEGVYILSVADNSGPEPVKETKTSVASCAVDDTVIYAMSNLKIDFAVTSKWTANNGSESYVGGEFKLTNISAQDIDGWDFSFDTKNTVKDNEISHGIHSLAEDGKHTIKSQTWNSKIPAGESKTVPMNVRCYSPTVTVDLEAGPIWNHNDAKTKCAAVADKHGGEWTGGWVTTVWNRMSVCGVKLPKPVTVDLEAGAIWSQSDAENKCKTLATKKGGEWTGHWSTTVPNRMSVCNISFK